MISILSIETATECCSIALHQEGQCTVNFSFSLPRRHHQLLMPFIQRALEIGQLSCAELSAVALSSGPGSYTGLRIGTASAKGIAYGQNIPLIAVNTLEAMIYSIFPYFSKRPPAMICALIDAGRGNAYRRVIKTANQVLVATDSCPVEVDSFKPWLEKENVYFIGSGAEKYKEVLQRHANAHIIPGCTPNARSIGDLAYQKYEKKEFESLFDFDPLYISAHIAPSAL